MSRALEMLAMVIGTLPVLVAMATLVGLGMHRDAATWAVSASTVLFVVAPPALASALVRRHRGYAFAAVAAVWGTGVFVSLPIYFPGERADALVTGLSLGSEDLGRVARMFADTLPEEPTLAEPEVPVAETLVVAQAPPPAEPLLDHQIALPYEGDGRRMSVEIAIEHGGEDRELQLLLDTGATYTTLPTSLLAELGIRAHEDDPVITLHTAGGEREARIVLVDRLWLGDLPMDGVAIATCDLCASDDTAGLLGLNVTGGYNLNIDADRREVVFSRRKDYSRHLDVKPFVEVGATVTRLPGQVSVEARLDNNAPRTVSLARASIHCRDETWLVELGPIEAGESATSQRKLPRHEPCERYQVGLHSAEW